MSDYVGWPSVAAKFLERACARHGGWESFRAVVEVRVRVVALGGVLPVLKGIGKTFHAPPFVRANPHEARTVFEQWPEPGKEGRFEDGAVHVGERDEAFVRASHRERMPALRWRPPDALYFFGYAVANYWALPFLLARTRFVKLSGRRLTVDFPEAIHTHSRRQSFVFDESGLLTRHDYVADVVGPWATGSHFSEDYVEVSGLWLARGRRVVLRLGSVPTPFPVLHARFEDIAVTRN